MAGPGLQAALGPLLALGGFALYSAHDVLVKILGPSISVVQIVFFAGLFSFPLVALLMLADPTSGTLKARNPGWVALRSFGVVSSGALGFYAFTAIPFAQAYAMLFASPLLVTLLAMPVLGERVGWRRGIAVAVGLTGVLVVLRPGFAEVSAGHLAGLASAFCNALVAISSRRIGRDERMGVLLIWPLLTTVVAMGAALPWVYRPMTGLELTMTAGIAALGIGAMLCMISAYRRAEASIVAPMQYSQMLWAVFWGALIFAEWPDGRTLAGAALIIGSGLYIVVRESARAGASARPVQSAQPRGALGPLS
jgi:S-adenosylmethionine uptake transporter